MLNTKKKKQKRNVLNEIICLALVKKYYKKNLDDNVKYFIIMIV